MKTYAGIGSRRLSQEEKGTCYDIGNWLARRGWALQTGAADGADSSFAEGAVWGGGKVTLMLPWPTYRAPWVQEMTSQCPHLLSIRILNYLDKEAYNSVDMFHPRPEKLSFAARGLHARNWLIVEGTKFVIAWPKRDQFNNYGGTGQGMRLTREKGIDLINLDYPDDYVRVIRKIR